MRYIRTSNDKIYDLKAYSGWEIDEDGNYHIWHHPKYSCVYYIDIEAEDVFKTSDTLEELCDEFVLEKNKKYTVLSPNEDGIFPRCSITLKIENDNIYGAIWTDKGLIYVAKMNPNGELELL